MPRFMIVILLLFPFASVSLAAQQAVVLRDTTLRELPYSDAAAGATLKSKTRLQVLQRKGGWYQVRDAARHTGWLRMSRIRMGDGSNKGGSSGLGQAMNFFSTGRSGASGVTVATGIRGLDAADVANAKPNPAAVKRLDRYQVNAKAASDYARKVGLHSKQLGYFKEKK